MKFANVLVVQPSLNVKTLADYINHAKSKPGAVTYASSGIGGAGHLAGELLKSVATIDIVHVPYKGGGPAMQGFLGGQVDSFFATPISSISQIRSGKAIAVVTTGSKRAALMPNAPQAAGITMRNPNTKRLIKSSRLLCLPTHPRTLRYMDLSGSLLSNQPRPRTRAAV